MAVYLLALALALALEPGLAMASTSRTAVGTETRVDVNVTLLSVLRLLDSPERGIGESWNGHAWSTVAFPDGAYSVSCPTATVCKAVGGSTRIYTKN